MRLKSVEFTCERCSKKEISQRRMVRWRKFNMCRVCYGKWWRQLPDSQTKRKVYLENNKEKIRIQRRTMQKNPYRRYSQSVCKARIMNKTWTIPVDTYIALIAQPCYYCGGKLNETAAGLDRIDNRFGYEVGNVLPCCDVCNRTRGKYWTVEETKVMILAVKEWRANKVEKIISNEGVA